MFVNNNNNNNNNNNVHLWSAVPQSQTGLTALYNEIKAGHNNELSKSDVVCPVVSRMAKTFALDSSRKLFQPISFIPAMLIGAVDLCDFVPLSVTGGKSRSQKSRSQHKAIPADFISSYTFQLNRMKCGTVMKHKHPETCFE